MLGYLTTSDSGLFDHFRELHQQMDRLFAGTPAPASIRAVARGSYPPINVFHKGDDFMIVVELPGVQSSSIDIQVRRNAIRISGTKSVEYDKNLSMHRRERLAGRFDRTVALPVEIDAERVKAECRNGILGVLLPRAERDKPRSVKVA